MQRFVSACWGTLRIRIWTCIHGFSFTIILLLYIRGDYEERVKQSLVESVRDALPTQAGQSSPIPPSPAESLRITHPSGPQFATALMHTVHDLVLPRIRIWGHPLGGIYETFFLSASQELNAPAGACGSCSHILVKVLKTAGFRARYLQLKSARGVYGAHIMVEAEVEPGHWAVLDPMFDFTLVRPDGRLASFQDVQGHFDYYRPQLPPQWGDNLRFEDARYTNWKKIPILMPALHKVLSWFMSPEDLRTFCLRAMFPNMFYTYLLIIVPAYMLLLTIRIVIFVRQSRRATPAPVTIRTSLESPASVAV